uniref:Uncharacterized protein n=1 Tax=Meloidogyne enterolobii TaxID=390850 RepID=A0A6V7US21_MELEN|nr:unnamed protein product [Meloidogyne enterolobii]
MYFISWKILVFRKQTEKFCSLGSFLNQNFYSCLWKNSLDGRWNRNFPGISPDRGITDSAIIQSYDGEFLFIYISSASTNTTVIKIKFHISTTFQLNFSFYPLVQWARSSNFSSFFNLIFLIKKYIHIYFFSCLPCSLDKFLFVFNFF